jgi:hypothetical protein
MARGEDNNISFSLSLTSAQMYLADSSNLQKLNNIYSTSSATRIFQSIMELICGYFSGMSDFATLMHAMLIKKSFGTLLEPSPCKRPDLPRVVFRS